jgi:hypothetical protein
VTEVGTVSKLINDNDKHFWGALNESTTGSVLLEVESSTKNAAGEFLPPAAKFTDEKTAPIVVIVTRATPAAAENVAALLARYRGDDPKAAGPDEKSAPRKRWFW